ncbi:UDP-glucosyltransferase 2-like [Leptidea sinapis]|uniref:UDP-glucosyltransferase 2-like n=1 Tax=Leptidea sinapis TaxID=189913 RepID=UPI0021C269C8|nr:UDP-glucosyltransferase 2-like [Leptidea sinapis]
MQVIAVNIFMFTVLSFNSDAAKILAVFPTPSISHQVVFRPIVQALAKKGHEVIVITPDPAFPKGKSPANLTEVDVHDLSYNAIRPDFLNEFMGDNIKAIMNIGETLELMIDIFEKQIQVPEVRDLMNDETTKFDMILVEAYTQTALGFGHFYKAPVIQISSLGMDPYIYNCFGAPSHPFLYPSIAAYRLYNLSIAEKIFELVRTALYAYIAYPSFEYGHAMMKRNFGKDVPNQVSLQNDVKMLFLNEHPIWSDSHPVPPNIKFLGGIHQTPTKALPQDLKKYLDTSEYGVIYVSFGSNAKPSRIPRDKINVMIKIFSTLPYDILWKWDADDLPGKSDNINFFKWLPQSDLLKHPNIKIFITQGGLQSTDEAINAAVPLIGIPLFGDQWYNVEKYVHHGIGIKLDILTLTENEFKVALEEILGNKSYRNNILRLRSLMREHPIPPVDMAVWWIEHILRFGSEHLKSPAAGLSLTQYYEIPLVLTIASIIFFILLVIIFIVWYFLHSICYYLKPTKKDQLVKCKTN